MREVAIKGFHLPTRRICMRVLAKGRTFRVQEDTAGNEGTSWGSPGTRETSLLA